MLLEREERGRKRKKREAKDVFQSALGSKQFEAVSTQSAGIWREKRKSSELNWTKGGARPPSLEDLGVSTRCHIVLGEPLRDHEPRLPLQKCTRNSETYTWISDFNRAEHEQKGMAEVSLTDRAHGSCPHWLELPSTYTKLNKVCSSEGWEITEGSSDTQRTIQSNNSKFRKRKIYLGVGARFLPFKPVWNIW